MSVDPGEGYRLLSHGDPLLSTDEVWILGTGPWVPLGYDTYDSDSMFDELHCHPCRRKLRGKPVRLYTTCNDLGVIGGVAYATEQDLPADNVREIKVDPSTGALYVEDGHGRPSGEA